jgi:DNA-binding CsgD family transcriptional regulator
MASRDKNEENRDYVSELVICNTSYDVFRVLKAVAIEFNYTKFMMMKLPNEADAKIADMAIITNWDAELIAAYDMMGFLSNSPLIKQLKNTTLPIVWNIDKLNENRGDGKESDVIDLFRDFDIINGVYFRVSDKNGNVGSLGVCGDRDPPTEAELMQLNYIANHAYEVLSNIHTLTNKVSDNLTDRERECIYWTASGKTSGDVAGILGISENTVNNYLTAAALKLNTVNKAHTVAKAVRYGLLDSI